MKTSIYVLLALILLLLRQVPGAQAQTKIQVVTKTIERKLDYNKHTRLRLSGEKASIRIQGWDNNYIALTLKLVAKHPDRAIAEQELEHLRYILEFTDNVHDIGNYFSVSKTTNPIRANLKAEYELMVPESCPLLITARYGEVGLSNTSGKSWITLEYSKLTLHNVNGDMQISSTMGDVTGTNLHLNLSCKAQRANLELTNAAGSYQIENTYGHIRIKPTDQLKKLQVEGNRTDVSVQVRHFDTYNYDLSATHSEIVLPESRKQKISSGPGSKSTFSEGTGKSKPLIKISTTNSPVTITQHTL